MKVKLNAPVRHDKKKYSKGDVVEMSEKQAERLVSLGFAEAAEAAEEKKSNEPQANSPKTDNESGDELKDPHSLEYMSIDQLKQELSILGISHRTNASKAQLIEMLSQAQAAGKNE